MSIQRDIIHQTKKWLSTIVIAHNLCPFAKRECENGTIDYKIIEAAETEIILQQLLNQCSAMDKDGAIETSLAIIPNGVEKFHDYLDVLDLATSLLSAQGYDGIYQLASFHPDYRFEETALDSSENYTNRSPYPMFHILREASVEAVLTAYPNPELIPVCNIALMQSLGLEMVRKALDACFK